MMLKNLSHRMQSLCGLLVLCVLVATPAAYAEGKEPQNIGLLKTQLKAYYACTEAAGCYSRELEIAGKKGVLALDRAARANHAKQKLAVVFDIDETALSNWDEIKSEDFGYHQKEWDGFVERGDAPAIEPTLKIAQEAQRLGVAIFFITGRTEAQRAATEKNLKSAGYPAWAGLTLRARGQEKTPTIEYKSAARKKIVEAGYRIVLNVGDQWSDLRGNPKGAVSLKLPNPFYYVP